MYRGSTLRNTAEAVGLVVNTGEECKIRMNAHKNEHAKAPAMQGIVNRIVALLVVFVVLLSVGCSLANRYWTDHFERFAWYLKGAEVPYVHILFGFIIMFNTLIPLSLYISLEIIKLGQLVLMQDVEMYDAETDTPMVANTTTILENLGQITHVFSDKTGTLTENKMRFRKMSVAGAAWLHDMDVVRDAEEKEKNERKRKLSTRRTGTAGTVASMRRSVSRRVGSRPSSRVILQPDSEPMDVPLIGGPQSPATPATPAPPVARRTNSTTASHWRSSVRPARAQPDLKTEDLIRYIARRAAHGLFEEDPPLHPLHGPLPHVPT